MKIHERTFFHGITSLPEEAFVIAKFLACRPSMRLRANLRGAICRAKEPADEKFMQSRGST